VFNLAFFKTDRFLAIVHQIRSLEDKEMLEEMKGHLTLLCRRVPYVHIPYCTVPYRTVPPLTPNPKCQVNKVAEADGKKGKL